MLLHFNQLKFSKIKFQNSKHFLHKKIKKMLKKFFQHPRGGAPAEYKKNALYAFLFF